tara:strand:+ start:247 stop:576 length:330 start_codon:yes stop_codon:yes gene_type:complete
MRLPHEKPDHIEEYLVTVRTGAWFSWSDINNKIYANLVVNDGGYKPTEKECTDGLASLQAEWDKNNADYVKKRRAEYPSIEEQLDNIYHNGVAGWKTSIKAIKDKYPKP